MKKISFNPRRSSVMRHLFSLAPTIDRPRSMFKCPFRHTTTFDSGYLIPIYADEVLPGDSFNLNMSSLVRFNTPLLPLMDNVKIDFQFFFVPNRLLWTNWQKFCGEQTDPGDSIDYTVPTVSTAAGGHAIGSLYDYFGVPTGVHPLSIANLHARAYNLIWNEWYRSQDLQDSVTVDTGDGPDTATDYVLLRRGKRFDYFTSCLPNPQKGDAVSVPLGTYAPVVTDGSNMQFVGDTSSQTGALRAIGTDGALRIGDQNSGWTVDEHLEYNDVGLRADLSDASSSTINEWREAFQIQRFLERDSRSGTRYVEILKAHFGVDSPDARLQRPEYLGGGSTDVNFVAVANTSDTTNAKQGDLAAIGLQVGSGIGFTKTFVEHGVILGLASVRADLTYQQGLNRMWSRSTRYDFAWPEFAHLGEQAVLSKEIYCDGTSGDDNVFGYQERYSEYKYKPSIITGKMRSSDPNSLDAYHLSQDFASRPTLNSIFIQETPPISRVVAVDTEPEFRGDFNFDVIKTRCLPMYAVPGMIDHF